MAVIEFLVHASTTTILLLLLLISLIPAAIIQILREKRRYDRENHDF